MISMATDSLGQKGYIVIGDSIMSYGFIRYDLKNPSEVEFKTSKKSFHGKIYILENNIEELLKCYAKDFGDIQGSWF